MKALMLLIWKDTKKFTFFYALASSLSLIVTVDAFAAGQFIVDCGYSHSLADDPIVFPNQPGASHLHDFFSNKSTNAASTYVSMQAGQSTCSQLLSDTAGYWAPALFKNGVKISPSGYGTNSTGKQIKVRERIYYTTTNLASGTKIVVPPPNFRMIAGNGHAMSASENLKLGKEIYWGCSDNSTGKLQAPPTSCPTGIISLHIGFPNCWDGVQTNVNDSTHVVYPSSGVCPSAFRYPIPRIIIRLEYPVGTSSGNIQLSSGETYSAHGDFWNTWQQPALESLISKCLNAGVDCGKNPTP